MFKQRRQSRLFRGEIYRGKDKDYYWRIRSVVNGNVVADCAEGYVKRSECRRMYKSLHPTIKLISASGRTS